MEYTVKKARPEYYQQEESILEDINPKWKDPKVREAEMENKIKNDVRTKEMYMDGMTDYIMDQKMGMGYLNAPSPSGRGYIRPPNARGGLFPLIPILSGIASLLLGSGISKRGGLANPLYHLQRQPNLNNASSFFRDIMDQSLRAGAPAGMVKNKLTKLFGGTGMFNKVMKGKIGGAVLHEPMKMGHLMAPILLGHMKNALKGTKIAPPEMLHYLESAFRPFLDREVSPTELSRGGSILSSLWKGAKSLFGSAVKGVKGFLGNKNVRDAGSKLLESTTGAIGKHGPKLIETAAERLSDYADKTMRDDEPTEEDIERVQTTLQKRERKARAKKLLEEDERRRRRRRGYDEEEEEFEPRRYEPTAIRRYELPAAEPSTRGRELVRQRRGQKEEVIPKKRRVIGFANGAPVYGDGLSKKKACGGSWVVKLTKK